ncbi:alpha/beta hydrolase [Pseudaminobacter arsenicus]|uniref:Alpha/beta hydrolase n=1 Tax=Borborobacter arsenicus TaxID=1851146 RepID=A0A432V7U6_9HYPH|nr:alpha/beta hydrolase-fold protein [Pseudaminobacter arsenicus]RUM98236.1 alpha/beta hydrolase [Pseudaminobacter arsenicus]
MQPVAVTPAQPRQPQPAALAIFDADVPTHRLERRLVETQSGRAFQLFFAIPRAAPPAAGYPLLYMLDGNAAFDALTPAHLEAAPGLAIIGIGYDTKLRFDVMARSLDNTPVEIPLSANGRRTGGADAFLDLLAGELRELAEAGIRVDPARRTLWGHSLAGLCTLYALMTNPGAFRRFVSVSPSVWWNDQWLLDFEAKAATTGREIEALVMLGNAERRSNPAGPHWEGPAPHTLEMVARLRRWPGLSVSMDIFGGLGHAATLPASFGAALAFAGKE